MGIACKIAVKFLSKQWLGTKTSSQFLKLVIIVTVINVVTYGFSGEDLKWFSQVTVSWLEVSDYNQLSDYAVRLKLCRLIRAKYSSLCTNHLCGVVIVMIN